MYCPAEPADERRVLRGKARRDGLDVEVRAVGATPGHEVQRLADEAPLRACAVEQPAERRDAEHLERWDDANAAGMSGVRDRTGRVARVRAEAARLPVEGPARLHRDREERDRGELAVVELSGRR